MMHSDSGISTRTRSDDVHSANLLNEVEERGREGDQAAVGTHTVSDGEHSCIVSSSITSTRVRFRAVTAWLHSVSLIP